MDLIKEKSVSDAIHTDALFESLKQSLDNEKWKKCIRLATLPTSSNMQLWEFYQITTLEVLEKLTGQF
jgi:hypothetical protein